MEDPTIPLPPPPHNSKKRLFAGSSSSSSFIDPDVIEIPPPSTWKSKPNKHKSIASCEVIVLDGEDPDDVVIIDEKVAPNAKGKKPMLNHIARAKVTANDEPSYTLMKNFMSGNSSSGVSFIDDDFEFAGMNLAETIYDEECAMLQAHFDSVDIPSGVEATVPWWPSSVGSGPHPVIADGSSAFGTQSSPTVVVPDAEQYQPRRYQNPLPVKSSVLLKYAPYDSKLPTSGLSTHASSYAKTNGLIQSELEWSLPPSYGPKNPASFPTPYNQYPFGGKHYPGWTNASQNIANPFLSHINGGSSTSASFPDGMFGSRIHNPSVKLDDGISAQISPPISHEEGSSGEHSFVKKLELFKKFDTLEDHSGHMYVNMKESCSKSKSWANKIADEWRMLERDLPGTIFVRVYEARMDLLRAVIVGADGTPYHDGLFFFDINFPLTYPNKPPLVNYHAHGLRLNPNLYNCGKVCLSLLGTWSGSGAENWRPGKSNMLQVLLSIQGLILNAEPYYNEPGYESSKNSPRGMMQSKNYSENAFLLSLKTMLYRMRNPPKYFEDLVFGHFYTHAHDILAACKAYLDGAEVGSFDKSKNPAAQVKRGLKCSELLEVNLPTYIKSLVEAFTKIGVEDCGKYLVPVDQSTNLPTKVVPSSRRKSKLPTSKSSGHFLWAQKGDTSNP